MIKKATIFLEHLSGGGEERALVTIANELAKLDIRVDVVLCNKKGVFLSELSSRIEVIDLNSSKYTSAPKLIPYLRENRPNVLISSLELNNWHAIIAAKLTGTKILIRIASNISNNKRSKFKKLIEKIISFRLYPLADGIIAVSHGVAEDLITFLNLSNDKIRVVYNPVYREELLDLSIEQLDHPWFGEGEPPVILGAGRLSPQKNFGLLIRAFEIVQKNMLARLVILGEGQLKSDLLSLIAKLGLEEAVDLPGFVSNPYNYFKKAGAFVLSSDWEGLPTVLIEALICECPVISTDCPNGPSEVLAGGKYGHLVQMQDEHALAAAIMETLSGNTKNVRGDWLDQFTIESSMSELFRAMDKFLPRSDI